MLMRIVLLIVLACLLVSCAQQSQQPQQQKQQAVSFPAGTWADLTHDFSDETIYWVNAESFKRTTVAEGMTDKGYYYSAYNYSAAEHGGTHIDAPVHFAEGRHAVEQIPLTQLTAPAIKIDVSEKAAGNRDYLVSVEDIQSWEKQNGQIPNGAIVLLQTGFGKLWPDKKQYLGTDQKGDAAVKDLHFPGLHPDAAKWLIQNRSIDAVGIDTASIDFGQSTTYEAHVALMTNNIPAFENVANLEQVPATGAFVIALPMKIKGGSGAPLRIVAFLPNQ